MSWRRRPRAVGAQKYGYEWECGRGGGRAGLVALARVELAQPRQHVELLQQRLRHRGEVRLAADARQEGLDAKLERDRGELVVKGIWWEPGERESEKRQRLLAAGLDRLARMTGAERWAGP